MGETSETEGANKKERRERDAATAARRSPLYPCLRLFRTELPQIPSKNTRRSHVLRPNPFVTRAVDFETASLAVRAAPSFPRIFHKCLVADPAGGSYGGINRARAMLLGFTGHRKPNGKINVADRWNLKARSYLELHEIFTCQGFASLKIEVAATWQRKLLRVSLFLLIEHTGTA